MKKNRSLQRIHNGSRAHISLRPEFSVQPRYFRHRGLTDRLDDFKLKEARLTWVEDDLPGAELTGYRFLNLLIDDGKAMVVVPAKLLQLDRENITVQLPEVGHVLDLRQSRRYPGRDVDAKVSQRGFSVKGKLVDFSPMAFRVRVGLESPPSFLSFNPKDLFNVQRRRTDTFFWALLLYSKRYRASTYRYGPLSCL